MLAQRRKRLNRMKKDLPFIQKEFGVRAFVIGKMPTNDYVPLDGDESTGTILAVPKENYKPLMEALEARHA